MSTVAERLKELNIELPPPVTPVGAYVPAVVSRNMAYVSGQLPVRAGNVMFSGRVGAELDLARAREAAALCFINVLAAVTSANVSLEKVRRVVRLMGHVQCISDFHEQHLVVNGASELCHKVFGEKGIHSRAALGAFALPLNAAVELEAIFELEA